MNAAMQGLARRVWRGEGGVAGSLFGGLLLPIEWVWRFAVSLRNRRFDRTAPTAVQGLYVISVGNLAVGGTGKTPITSWLAKAVAKLGGRPAILHGGYGRDEPMLHERWTPDVPVFVDRDRVAGGRSAVEQGADVAVLDDGFQHRRMARDVDLVVLAVEDAFPGPLLPRGPYREPVASLDRADAIVISRRTATDEAAVAMADRVRALVPGTPVVACVHLEPAGLRPLVSPVPVNVGPSSTEAVGPPRLDQVMVLTAVGRPDTVLENVRRVVGGDVSLRAYADHHEFSRGDVRDARQRAGGRPIVVTEKDAVKLERFADELGTCYVIQQTLTWDWGEQDVCSLLRMPRLGR